MIIGKVLCALGLHYWTTKTIPHGVGHSRFEVHVTRCGRCWKLQP